MPLPNGWIDFRSDTVTHPTEAMRKAMATAEVGDDVYQDDPTIIELEELAAQMTGKEAGLFVPSGTMGNLVAILVHCNRGDEAIMGSLGHTFLHEVGGISALGGVFAHVIQNNPDGTLSIEEIRKESRGNDIHEPRTRLVIIENTQNQCGGVPIGVEYMQAMRECVREMDMHLHLDGARIFNAATALNMDVKKLISPADSVMFCLSKGLCAPVGSMICGSMEFIQTARKIRKQVGGGMRQAGILAAAGKIALSEMTKRLGEDHEKAKKIAKSLCEIPDFVLNKGEPLTNMVFTTLAENFRKTPGQIQSELKDKGILVGLSGPREFRFVTHYWIENADIVFLIETIKEII